MQGSADLDQQTFFLVAQANRYNNLKGGKSVLPSRQRVAPKCVSKQIFIYVSALNRALGCETCRQLNDPNLPSHLADRRITIVAGMQ